MRPGTKEELANDEAVQYIARRHHATVEDVIDGIVEGANPPKVELEDNEKNIMLGLIRMYNDKE